MSKSLALLSAGVLAASLSLGPAASHAQDEGSAMQQLQDAVQDSQEAVAAPTDEEAKEESNEMIRLTIRTETDASLTGDL
jgi:hypothetical protein